MFRNHVVLLSPESEGGKGGGKKYAGKFSTPEELEKSYIELETKLGERDETRIRLEQRVYDLERQMSAPQQKNQSIKGDSPARKALEAFENETDFDELVGKDLIKAHSKLYRLNRAVEKEDEELENANKSEREKEKRKEKISSDLQKIADEMKYGSDAEGTKYLNEVEAFMNKNKIDDVYQAHSLLQRTKTKQELEDYKAEQQRIAEKQKKDEELGRAGRRHPIPNDDTNKDDNKQSDNRNRFIRPRKLSAEELLSNPKIATHLKALEEEGTEGQKE